MNSRFRSDLAFLDMLFNMALAFAFLFLMAFLLIRPPAEDVKAVQMKAEFIITLSWPDGALDDQDLWVLLPNGKKVGFTNKDLGYATLDRDDRGSIGNIFVDENGESKIVQIRREILTIRAIIPGRYVVNVHTFSKVDQYAQFTSKSSLPYKVTVVLTKINPSVTEVVKSEVLVESLGDEITAFAFSVNEEGNITSIEKDADEQFVGIRR